MSRKVVIAPNAFKNSLVAEKVAEAIAEGFQEGDPSCECVLFPIGDGGDGTGALLARHLDARRVAAKVDDPLGSKIDAQFYLTREGIAIIELADASGLRLLKNVKLDIMRSSTFGTGELIRSALDEGAKEIILCVGGSATIDAGTGILRALGFQFLDASGADLIDLPAQLHNVLAIDPSNADPRIFKCPIKVLVDVQSVVSGRSGCARLFGAQKGATPDQIEILQQGVEMVCEVIYKYSRKRVGDLAGGGAAGGVAAMLCGVLHAELVNGIEHFLDLTGFDHALSDAALVITGEGQLDDQTLQGKGPLGVAIRAKKKGIKVAAVAGRIEVHESDALLYFDALLPIQSEVVDLEKALASTYENLQITGKAIALKYFGEHQAS